MLLQYPGASGAVRDHAALIEAAHGSGALVTVAADLLALTLLRAPGEIGADVAVGTAQRFGVPMGFGGPHAGYMAVRNGPGAARCPAGWSGCPRTPTAHPAYRLALQTREQHIRREKATSNICTAQVLLAVMASMYAVYHGPDGLRAIAERVARHGRCAGRRRCAPAASTIAHDAFFDTVTAVVPGRAERGRGGRRASAASTCGWSTPTGSAIACDETTTARAPAPPCSRAFGLSHGDVAALDAAAARAGRAAPRDATS